MLVKLVMMLTFISSFFTSIAIAENKCKEVEIRCSIPNQTRKVRGTDVHRECWEYRYKLDCKNRSKDDCGKIPNDICAFIKEECIDLQQEGDSTYCANLKRRFSCEKVIEYEEETEELLKNGKQPDAKDLLCKSMCLDGDCTKKADLEDNKELTQAVGMLNGLAQAKKGVDADIKDIINVFKGDSRSCSYHPLNFMNCCRERASGWGEAISLGQCRPEELDLARARREKRCIEVGQYCETRLLGWCVDKRKVMCCYDSVIARILNQEGKRQLGRNFGSPRSPSCEGLSRQDLENPNLDLSKADFTDFYNEVVIPNIKVPDVKTDMKHAEDKAKEISEDVKDLPTEKQGFSKKALSEIPE